MSFIDPPRAILARALLSLLALSILAGCERDHHRQATLRVALPGQPTTFDPNKAYDAISGQVLTQLHEGLTRHDANLTIQPALAESWDFNDAYTEITFTLKPDIKWSDGKPIVASDFEYSWKRLLDPGTRAEYAYFLYDIEGAEAYNSEKGTRDGVEVTALDDRRLRIKLNRPAPYFPHIASFMVTYPVRKDLVEAHGDRWTDPDKVAVSGPFRPVEYMQDYRMVLEPNPHYSLGEVRMKRVELYQIAEKSTALNLFVAGRMDLVLDMLPLAIPEMKKRDAYYNGPKLEVRYVGYRIDKPPMDNVKVRQALAMALDRSELPAVLKGGEIGTRTWLPPGMFGHAPKVGLPHDPERARALLGEAGYPGGEGFPEVLLLYRAGDDWRLIAENLQQQWKRELGITVRIEVREQKVFFQEIDGESPPPMHLARWVADFPDPENFMGLFKSNSGNNSLGIANKRFDKSVDDAVQTDDRSARKTLYDDAQRVLLEEDVAMAPLYVNAQNHLRNPDLAGLEFNAMGDLFLGPVYWKSEHPAEVNKVNKASEKSEPRGGGGE